MPKLSKQDRKEAEAIVAEIERRPAFHVACVYLERARRNYGEAAIGRPDANQNGWIGVSWLSNIVLDQTGAHVLEETLLLALEATGFKVRFGRRGAETNLAEQVLLDARRQTEFGKYTRGPRPDLSDPTDAQTGLH